MLDQDEDSGDDDDIFAEAEEVAKGQQNLSYNDFYAYMPMHDYIYAPTNGHWPSGSVNARLPKKPRIDKQGRPMRDKQGNIVYIEPTAWLDKHRPVEQMTWAPGYPMIIRDKLIINGGWVAHGGASVFNQYRPPEPTADGDPSKAERWAAHLRYIYPDEADHIINWLAHRVQRPQDKINHALVLGGPMGIGKDTLLEPVKRAIGPWNFQEASPQQVLGRFNGFLMSVILRVSEARDLGDYDRFAFYDHMKTYTAVPPDTLRIDEKNIKEYCIPNCCSVIITTNHKTDGIYLPADDRRNYVAWSARTKEDTRFQNGYWDDLWGWYEAGGFEHVAALLHRWNLSGFDPKAPPPETAAFWAIADANVAPEAPELADAIDELGEPNALTLAQLKAVAGVDFGSWLGDRKNRRIIPHRMEECGYVPVRNPDAKDGLWKIQGKRQTVYAKASLSRGEQLKAARDVQAEKPEVEKPKAKKPQDIAGLFGV
jgi:hypothetical protein